MREHAEVPVPTVDSDWDSQQGKVGQTRVAGSQMRAVQRPDVPRLQVPDVRARPARAGEHLIQLSARAGDLPRVRPKPVITGIPPALIGQLPCQVSRL